MIYIFVLIYTAPTANPQLLFETSKQKIFRQKLASNPIQWYVYFMNSVSVILPTYNESELIKLLVNHIDKLLKDRCHEIIVVDDNSPDRTWEIVQNMKNENVRLIRRMKNRGLTNSLNEGIAAAKYAYVVWMDADFSHPPELIPEMLIHLDEGDYVEVKVAQTSGGELDVKYGHASPSFMMARIASD